MNMPPSKTERWQNVTQKDRSRLGYAHTGARVIRSVSIASNGVHGLLHHQHGRDVRSLHQCRVVVGESHKPEQCVLVEVFNHTSSLVHELGSDY